MKPTSQSLVSSLQLKLLVYLLCWAFLFDGFRHLIESIATAMVSPVLLPLNFLTGESEYGAICAVVFIWGIVSLLFAALWNGSVAGEGRQSRWLNPLGPGEDFYFAAESLWLVITLIISGALDMLIMIIRRIIGPQALKVELPVVLAVVFICICSQLLVAQLVVAHSTTTVNDQAGNISFWKRYLCNTIRWSVFYLPLTMIVATKGVVVAWWCSVMVIALRGARTSVPFSKSGLKTVSFGIALVLFGISFAQCLRFGLSILEWPFVVQRPQQADMSGYYWVAIALTSGVTCVSFVLRFPDPILRITHLSKVSSDPAARTLGLLWRISILPLTIVAIIDIAAGRSGSGGALLLAAVVAFALRSRNQNEVATIAFVIVPRWIIWCLLVAQVGGRGMLIAFACECLLLVRTWRPAGL